ncbi:tyrosine-type recombinase/integrase [Terrarubrum flagellatum]|uniref:tyrosine-type recombinase/integrase n=1 Tax=Terrirubrum flagellatum TaxID=2895980 RepID=UPI0031454C3C
MALDDVTIRGTKPETKVLKLSDGGGLQLWITPTGARTWRLAYRFGGRQKLMPVGAYPKVGLKEARKARDAAKALLEDGLDPAADRLAKKAAAALAERDTFGLIADELIARKKAEDRAAATVAKTEWLLSFALPTLRDRPIADIKAAEVLAVLRTVEARGRRESARRLRSVVGEVFRLAIATARAENDPTSALRGALLAPKTKHRAAIIEAAPLGGLLRAIDAFDGQPTTRAALQLMALLFPRPGELRLAEWPEFDLETAVWTIPGARTKMRRPHRVPLPPQAIVILKDLRKITGRGVAGLVFPGVRTVRRPISENTLNGALRAMGFSQEAHSAHGFRSSFSTLANESGLWSRDAIERALAHVEENDVRRAYARGEHWEERVRMAAWWGEELNRLRRNGGMPPTPKPEH